MTVELECSKCAGRLMAEPGTVVRCPHCGTQLTISDDGPPGVTGILPPVASAELRTDVSSPMPSPSREESPRAAGDELSPAGSDQAPRSQSLPADEAPARTSSDLGSEASLSPSTRLAVKSPDVDSAPFSGVPVVVPPPDEFPEAPDASPEGPSENEVEIGITTLPGGEAAESAVARLTDASRPSGRPVTESSPAVPVVPKLWFVIAMSYASAVTIALMLLAFNMLRAQPHELESLPDLKPPQKDDEIALRLVPEKASMPTGHTLQIGEERRFGNVTAKPLRVTRGPLEFVHYSGDEARTRPPTGEVLKLWLQFTNVSDNQTFAPLDRELMLTRVFDDSSRSFRANNFVCRVRDKRRDGDRVMIFDISPTSDWELKGQHIGRRLQPGESFVTYIATEEEGIDALQGELIWRVHFRKGYHPKSRRGVTTLIEIAFSSDEIVPETG